MVGAVAIWNTYVPNSEFRISQKEVQTYLDERLPQTNTWTEISDANVEFKQNKLLGTVYLRTNEFAGYIYTMRILAEGRPRYEAHEKTFYFNPTNVLVETTLLLRDAKTHEETLCAVPTSLSPTTSIESLRTTMLLKADEFARVFMRGILITTLQQTPVYELPNDIPGAATALFLEDVSVVEGEMIFGLTLSRAICLVLAVFLVTSIGITVLVAVVRNPVPMLALVMLCVLGT